MNIMVSDSLDVGLCFNRALRRSSNRLLALYNEALAPCGLLAMEFAILAQIQRTGSASIAELADAFFMDRATFRYKLGSLERAGLVVLTPDARDKRTRRLELTEKGLAKLAEASDLWRAAQARFEAAVGAERAAAFKATADVVASSAFADAFRA